MKVWTRLLSRPEKGLVKRLEDARVSVLREHAVPERDSPEPVWVARADPGLSIPRRIQAGEVGADCLPRSP